MHGREIFVMLLAVQDQADIDVEQAQEPALVGIVVGDSGEIGRRCRDRAVARLLGGLLVDIDGFSSPMALQNRRILPASTVVVNGLNV
jgi:hypothetical protein